MSFTFISCRKECLPELGLAPSCEDEGWPDGDALVEFSLFDASESPHTFTEAKKELYAVCGDIELPLCASTKDLPSPWLFTLSGRAPALFSRSLA
jgi:hypothetical protein